MVITTAYMNRYGCMFITLVAFSYCYITDFEGHACGEIRWRLLNILIFGPGVGKLLLSACMYVSVQGALSVK